MKDNDAKFEEWWEVAKEYFAKELKKNMVQHKTNERSVKYKLEIYYRNFPKFVYGSLTSRKTLGQDEENEARPSGTIKEEEIKCRTA